MTIPISMLLCHLVGDFLFQSNWMALGKSKRLEPLLIHCLVYSVCFIWWGIPFVALTFLTHLATDAITSRITSRLWFIELQPITEAEERSWTEGFTHLAALDSAKRHWFFVAIGVDQFIHYVTLAWTLKLLS